MGMLDRLRLALTLLIPALLLASLSPAPASADQFDVFAPYWVVYDVTSERILADQHMNQPVPMASLTKMMTGLLVVENLSMEDEVVIVEEDQVGEASIWAEAGDVYTVRTLLHGLMMRSGNDAASALARAVGGSPDAESQEARDRFTVRMNIRAQQLGMKNTRFHNPHGLDADDHFSSAHDLMLLTKEALNHPQLIQPLGAALYSGEGFHFGHTNQLPNLYDGVIGGKTGWTSDAGLCLIQIVERDGRILIVVLLGSTFERWYPDATDLLEYGWKLPGVPRANRDTGFTQW